ncbi:MAG: hypothetical protein IKM43_02390 [Clostridia bacterium]|nr:hypothetical protein [Clostridia bacterium]
MQFYNFDYNQQTKRKTKTNHLFKFLILSVFVILLIIAIIKIFYKKQKLTYFYFVEIGLFQNYTDAYKCALDIQQKNAGGYIYYDGHFHVIANYYLDIDSAEKVVSNIITEYTNCKILTLKTKDFKHISSLSDTQNQTVENINNQIKIIIETLYTLMINYDTACTTEKSIKLQVLNLHSDLSKIFDEYCLNFTNNKYEICKTYFLNILNSLQNIYNTENLSQSLKYELINITLNYVYHLNTIC